MIGIVGKILIKFVYAETKYEQIVELDENSSFILDGIDIIVEFQIEAINYIEDTIYGIELSLGDESWWISGNEPTYFTIDGIGVSGTFKLFFIN